jgi:hypothetical protein
MNGFLFLRSRTSVVWLILIVSTLVSWWLGADHGFSADGRRIAVSIVIIVAFAKVYLIGQHFMELRHAPVALNTVFNGWVVAIATAMISVYTFA